MILGFMSRLNVKKSCLLGLFDLKNLPNSLVLIKIEQTYRLVPKF